MPSVLPFHALRHARKSGAPLPGLDSPNPSSLLRRWRDEGALVPDSRAAYHVLELQPVAEGGVRRVPVRYLLGALKAEDIPALEEDPRPLTPLAPVPLLAADDHQVLRSLLAESAGHSAPEIEARVDGLLARLWRLDEPRLLRRTVQALDEVDVRPLGPVPAGASALAAVVPLSDPGLVVRPLHRGVRGLGTFREETFLTLVQGYARTYDLESSLLTDTGRREALERMATLATGYHAVLLVLPGGRGKILRFRQALDLAHIKAAPRNPTLRSLDLALLNALVLRTVLGIPEPEVAGHAQVFPVPSLEKLVAQVDEGVFQAGFGLNPPPLWEIRAVMEARQQLPSRTLIVEPTPPPGLLFLDEGA